MASLWIEEKQFSLKPGSNLLGRGSGCNIQLPHPTLSIQHLSIELAQDNSVTVVDLGSVNGFKVNGVRCPSATFQEEASFEVGGIECRLSF